MNEHQRKARAERVGSIRGDIEQVLKEMEGRYVERWKKADTIDKREDAHRMVRLAQDFRSHMFAVAMDGAMADQAIALQDKKRFWPLRGQ